MRTKEINVLVSESFLDNSSTGIPNIIEDNGLNTRLNGVQTFKAKLIIELPERKVEISESELDEALFQVFEKKFFAKDSAFYNGIKAKIFKE